MPWSTHANGRISERGDDTARTVTTYNAAGQVSGTRAYTPAESAAADARAADDARKAALDQLRNNIVTQAIAWLETDAAAATRRAGTINAAVTTATTRRTQVQGFTFNGSNVTNINAQLNNSLKPILVDMLTYIIGLGNLAQGTEEWRGTKADPALVWLARHATDTTDP